MKIFSESMKNNEKVIPDPMPVYELDDGFDECSDISTEDDVSDTTFPGPFSMLTCGACNIHEGKESVAQVKHYLKGEFHKLQNYLVVPYKEGAKSVPLEIIEPLETLPIDNHDAHEVTHEQFSSMQLETKVEFEGRKKRFGQAKKGFMNKRKTNMCSI